MNLLQLKNLTLKLCNQFSSDGIQLTSSEIADFNLTYLDLLNIAYNKIIDADPVEDTYQITQNYVDNLIDSTTSFALTKHLGDDIIYEATGAKSYTFKVDRPATVYVEEETAADTWTTLETLALTPTAFTVYADLITASDTDNNIRLRFSGSGTYNVINVGLYAYTFSDTADIPQCARRCRYALPTDFIRSKKVDFNDGVTDREFSDYRIINGYFEVDYTYEGIFDILYQKQPAALALDTDVPVIESRHHSYLAYFAASQWLRSTGKQADGDTYFNIWDGFLSEIRPNNDETSSGIINVNQW